MNYSHEVENMICVKKDRIMDPHQSLKKEMGKSEGNKRYLRSVPWCGLVRATAGLLQTYIER